MANPKTLKWRFDVNSFRLLGRELITDRITALVELVKNAYDANATEVLVEFHDVGKKSDKSKIIIKDNGTGMTLNDVENKWMVVGTNSKRVRQYSPKPFNRKYIGKKGIGRFAVDKLGSHLLMLTKTKEDKKELSVVIDWSNYERLSNNYEQLNLFTEIENQYTLKEKDTIECGTTLIISKINEIWTKIDIARAYKELAKIISPFHKIDPPFNILISSNEYPDIYTKKYVIANKIEFASNIFELKFDKKAQLQDTLYFNKKTGKLEIQQKTKKSFGLINFKIFHFNEQAKKKFNKKFKPKGIYIDGIKIYRDNLLTTPFAEYRAHPFKQRDVLGIDKRLWQNTFDTVGNREFIGIIHLSKEDNPRINDATNRQDFIDNEEYRDLKDFIVQQLDEISKYKVFIRNKKKEKVNTTLSVINADIKTVVKDIKKHTKEVKKHNPLLAKYLNELETKMTKASVAVQTAVKVNKQIEKEAARKENLYLSLMSLQEYATNLSHTVRTSLGKIKRLAEFFKTNYPNPKYDKWFLLYSSRIYDEINTLGRVIDFMLSYAKADMALEDFSVKECIEHLFNNIYNHVFDIEGIEGIVDINTDFILNGNRKFFEDIFENLIANSIKALKDTPNKIIKCTAGIEQNSFVYYFSDNGEGIKKGDEEKIFEVYYTTTAEIGGAGLGLFIVQKRIEALKGDIKVIDSEFGETGATFKITLPFKK